MVGTISRWCGVVVVCLSGLAVLAMAPGTASASKAQYEKAYRIGLEAYTYGLPLLETNKTFLTMTSINVSKNGFGPVNQFNSVRKLNNPASKAVVAPGSSTLSSVAWLDLTREPQVLHVPRVKNHFFVLGLIDPVHRGHREPRQRPRHQAGLLRHLRARPALTVDPGRDAADRRQLHAHLDHRVDPAEGQEGPRQRAPHTERLHADAAQQVRLRLQAEAPGASAQQGQGVLAAREAALLRRARAAAPEVPAAGRRPSRPSQVRRGRDRPREAALAEPPPEPPTRFAACGPPSTPDRRRS